MANKKYKLTDGNYWATDGVYDFDQGKTQREVNGDLIGAITNIGNLRFVSFGAPSVSITTQVDAIGDSPGIYAGNVSTNTVGMPTTSGSIIVVYVYNNRFKHIYVYANGSNDTVYQLEKTQGSWRTEWVELPASSVVSTLQGDVSTLQGDVSTLQGDVSTLQGDVTTLQGNVSTLLNGINNRARVIQSTNKKLTHTITVPSSSSHFLIIYAEALSTYVVMFVAATSTGSLGYDVFGQGTGSGAPSIAYNTGNFTITYNTERNLYVGDICVFGNFCSLS